MLIFIEINNEHIFWIVNDYNDEDMRGWFGFMFIFQRSTWKSEFCSNNILIIILTLLINEAGEKQMFVIYIDV